MTPETDPGEAFLPAADIRTAHEALLSAPPGAVWPWLAQMGRGRAGLYSVDLLDNGGRPSARELHPGWMRIAAGDRLPAGPGGSAFDVLRADAPRALVLGWGAAGARVRATWAFSLEEAPGGATRLRATMRVVRPRAARPLDPLVRAGHALMQRAQLRNLARRAEGRVRATGWRDAVAGLGGLAVITGALLTPPLRRRRATWGAGPQAAARDHPGDDVVRAPRWGWTHAVAVDAPPEAVWPWVAQLGADRAGFYSYTWLENLAGCRIRDAERIHPEWAARPGDHLVLHPSGPPLEIREAPEGRHLLAVGPADPAVVAAGRPWAAASWLIATEPLGGGRSRLVSRYRCVTSRHLGMRLAMGPALMEPIGFAMDRRMLRTIRRRVERAARER